MEWNREGGFEYWILNCDKNRVYEYAYVYGSVMF